MKEQLSSLIELQQVDLAIGKIIQRKKELPEKINKLEEEFNSFVAKMDTEKKQLDELQKRHKEKEDKLKKNAESLKKTKDRLHEVKTNKEYQAILKEIETIESKNSEVEDEIIVALEELDHIRDLLKSQEQTFDAFQVQCGQDKGKMEKELIVLDAELLTCQKKSGDLGKRIPENLLKRYEIIKGRNNGLAVISVWKEVCNGCHMNLPPQLYNELQKTTELMSCPNCNRIIYWRNQDQSDNG